METRTVIFVQGKTLVGKPGWVWSLSPSLLCLILSCLVTTLPVLLLVYFDSAMDGTLLRIHKDPALSLYYRVVGGFDTLTAMENVESDPKTDRPKVCTLKNRGPLPTGCWLGKSAACSQSLSATRRKYAYVQPLCLWTPMRRLMPR